MDKIISVCKVLLTEFIVSVMLLLAIAFIVYKTGMGQSTARILIVAVYALATFLGGMIIGKAQKSRRLLWGAAAGGLYILVLLLVSMLVKSDMAAEGNILAAVISSVAGGGIGGMCS